MINKKKILLQTVFIILFALILLIFSNKEVEAISFGECSIDNAIDVENDSALQHGNNYRNFSSNPYLYCLNHGYEFASGKSYMRVNGNGTISPQLSYILLERNCS